MEWREPVDIAHVHVPGGGLVRGKDNRSDGGRFSGADCIVQGIVDAHLGWAEIWSGGIGGFEIYGGDFWVGCDGEFA